MNATTTPPVITTPTATTDKPMTIGNWLVTLLVLSIPIVNLVMLTVWAAGGTPNQSKKTYCQAILIWFGIIFAVAVFAALLIPLIAGFSGQ